MAGPFGRPSCGAFAAPIERITGKTPFYVGKPSAFMMRAALRHMAAHSAEACMVGDNMETDIIAGVQSGMTTVLVLTGVSREADLERFAHRPDHVVADAFALRELLERASRGRRREGPQRALAIPRTRGRSGALGLLGGQEDAGLERAARQGREAHEPSHLADEPVGLAQRPGVAALQDRAAGRLGRGSTAWLAASIRKSRLTSPVAARRSTGFFSRADDGRPWPA